ncbi:MFN2, partial [Cordylochernes scorpioides]
MMIWMLNFPTYNCLPVAFREQLFRPKVGVAEPYGDVPMAGYLNRSLPHSPVDEDMPATRPEALRVVADASPLKIFVLAKRKINDIFLELADHVEASYKFLENLGLESQVVTQEQLDELEKSRYKIVGIREVLARDHMKVVFFGRTSNGKSTVINAMLQDKILPSGLGHTTNCFLQVEGSDSQNAFLLTEDSHVPKNVQSVDQLGNAIHSEAIGENSLVRIFWPKQRCPLLRDDVVLLDSPGIDVSTSLDEWIDKHCLDADVFVLVANSESTLMLTEKNFFHKVSERLSKPNVFILNNRWDASVMEPESQEKVRKQHLERNVAFLVDELKVSTRAQAENRVFFVSAKEVLQARLQSQVGLAPHTGALGEGFQNRYFEFQDFERKFEECLSQTAVKTKFEQHAQRGHTIISNSRAILEAVYERGLQQKEELQARRQELKQRLEMTKQQHILATNLLRESVFHLVETVEQRVAAGLAEEIRKLQAIIAEYDRTFNTEPLVLDIYKKELHSFLDQRIEQNLRTKLDSILQHALDDAHKDMLEKFLVLIPENHQGRLKDILPQSRLELTYRLSCDRLCADFEEDLSFRFSLGLWSMGRRLLEMPPPTAPQTPSNEAPRALPAPDYLAIVQKMALVSPASQTALGGLAISVLCGWQLMRTVGWRVIAISLGIYGTLYIYERVTWTTKAKERAFKKQYVAHATRKLRLIVDLTSANCGHQVKQLNIMWCRELGYTFSRLNHLVEQVVTELQTEIQSLDLQLAQLEDSIAQARILKYGLHLSYKAQLHTYFTCP